MPAIVGSRTDNAEGHRQWQASTMDVIVLILFTLALLGIVAAALMIIGVALDRRKTG